MGISFYLAQISAIIAWIFLIGSYWKNKSNMLLYLQIISCVFFILNYVFLGAYTGLIVVFFEIFRDYFYTKSADQKKVFYCCIPVYTLIAIFSFDGFWSLFSIFASVNDGYALMYKGKKVVVLGIVTYILWIIYDIYCQSYINVFAQALLVVSNILILIRGRRLFLNSDRLVMKKGISMNSFHTLYKMDKELFHEMFLFEKGDLEKGIKNKIIDYLVLKYENKDIGYVNFARISKRKYDKITNGNDFERVNYRDLLKQSKDVDNYLNIINLSIDYDYQNKVTNELVSEAIRTYLINQKKSGFNIIGVVSTAVLDNEKSILENCQFQKTKNYRTNYQVYKLQKDELKKFVEGIDRE